MSATITDDELQAIHLLATRVRKATTGAGEWDAPGLWANLLKLRNRNLHLTVEHVLRHAADPKAKSPGVLAGSFTPPAPESKPVRMEPPRRDEECRSHPGQWATNCGGCRSDELAAVYDDEVPSRPASISRPVKAAEVPAYVEARDRIRRGAGS